MADSREILAALLDEFDLERAPEPARHSAHTRRVFFVFVPRIESHLPPWLQDPRRPRMAICRDFEDSDTRTVFVRRDGAPNEGDSGSDGIERTLDPTRELTCVAHELGHHLLWLGRRFPPEFPKEGSRPAPRVYSEEVLAWAIASHLLETRGFEEWDRFREERRKALESYREGLPIDAQQAQAIELELLGNATP